MLKFLLLLCLVLPGLLQAQQDGSGTTIAYTWEKAPVFLQSSAQWSRFRRAGEEPYPMEAGYSAGIFLDYAFKQRFPFRIGLEGQFRSFSLNSVKEGSSNYGKRFLKTIEGRTRMLFLQVPVYLELQPRSKERTWRFLAGLGSGVRLWTRQNFSYRYEIPADSILITGSDNSGNDAMDLLEFNALGAFHYRPHPKWEFALSASCKLFGFSLGKENFVSRSERNSLLEFRMYFLLFRMENFHW